MSHLRAVIDMGTNTFHLLLARVGEDGSLEKLTDQKLPVMLGRGGISDGRITPEAMQRGLDALMNFTGQAREAGIRPDEIQAFATSAVRSASNSAGFLSRILEETGLRVQVIEGRTEAEMIFRGVAASGALEGLGTALVMDIGGGSVEFILTQDKNIAWLESFEIGGQRLMDAFMDTDPVRPEQILALDAWLETRLEPLFRACVAHPPQALAGASGTFDTIHDMARYANVGGRLEGQGRYGAVSPAFISSLKKELCRKDRSARLAIPGMIEMRVDMIVMAVCLLDLVVRRIGVGQVRCSPYALKEGALMHQSKV